MPYEQTLPLQRLLDEGVETDLGERWNTLVAPSVALTTTPAAFGVDDIGKHRAQGLDYLAITDLIQRAVFFNWADCLMLSLGEPTPAAE